MNRVACHWRGGKGSESNMLGWIFLKLECRRRQAQSPNIEKNNVTVITMLHKRRKLIFWAPGPVDIRVAKYIRQIQGFYKKFTLPASSAGNYIYITQPIDIFVLRIYDRDAYY